MPDLNLGTLTIDCPSLDGEGRIPDRCTAEGGNEIPDLTWSGVPDGAAELVLVLHDPDAPLIDGFTHWIVTGIDPASSGVKGGDVDGDTDPVTGQNEMGEAAYMGPAPPPGHGRHHYFFHLYALDQTLAAGEPLTRRELLSRLERHVIEQARVVGTYERG